MLLHMLQVLLHHLQHSLLLIRKHLVAVGAVKLGVAGQLIVACSPGAVTHVGAVTSCTVYRLATCVL
jgi:hypothetical protein